MFEVNLIILIPKNIILNLNLLNDFFILIQIQSGNYLIFYLDYNIQVIYKKIKWLTLNGIIRL